MRTSTKVLFGSLMIIVGFAWVGFCVSVDMPGIVTYLVFFILAIAILCAGFVFDEKQQAKTQRIYTYHESTRSLRIISTNHSKLRWILQVEPAHTIQYKFNPATLEYTGVTIGGVTTGSFHVNEASISGGAFQNTGKYQLVLKDDGRYEIIKEIVFPDSLVTSAKNTPIVKDFLKGNSLVLEHTGGDAEYTPSERQTIAAAERDGRRDIALNVAMRAIAASFLTKAECDAIKNWLCG